MADPTRRRRPPPHPDSVRFVPKLAAPPLDFPRRTPPDPVVARRAKADRLCLWIACARVACRKSRHCRGQGAPCVFEQDDVQRPLLEEVATPGPR